MANHPLVALTTFMIMVVFLASAGCFTGATAAMHNVKSLGAKPDGKTDSTKAFMSAWTNACASVNAATVYVPQGRYMVGGLTFSGPCKNGAITVRIDGTLVAPSNYFVLGKAQEWVRFYRVQGVTILGGTLDAQGSGLWACKASKSKNCPAGATSLAILNSNNVLVYGVTSLNSQMFHMVVNGCRNVRVVGANVVAPWDSPNTDGIHVQLSTGVTILNSKISTGDDCVSIGQGANNLWVEGVSCGPGHGISIGSLGNHMDEQGVRNVTVKRSTFKGTDNGLRIKAWAKPIEGDENSHFFHGILNKRRKEKNVRGIMKDGTWIDNPILVKDEFLTHFQNRFARPADNHLSLTMDFPKMLSLDQKEELESEVTRGEIKRAVWDCGVDKSPGPDGFTFGFYRRFWDILENDVVKAVLFFFKHGTFAPGCNSTFITLIPKSPNANLVKDFRPISLIGSLYKIITKILANRLTYVISDLIHEVQYAFVSGLKQGDSLSPFLFILVMKSLHLSFQRVVDAGLFTGINLNSSTTISHLFFADDAVFVGSSSGGNRLTWQK
nr:polygalacturonase-like [Tanacetum cinerariifolium]